MTGGITLSRLSDLLPSAGFNGIDDGYAGEQPIILSSGIHFKYTSLFKQGGFPSLIPPCDHAEACYCFKKNSKGVTKMKITRWVHKRIRYIYFDVSTKIDTYREYDRWQKIAFWLKAVFVAISIAVLIWIGWSIADINRHNLETNPTYSPRNFFRLFF